MSVLFAQPKNKTVTILKANGSSEIFNPFKLEHSLLKAGASPSSVQKVIERLEGELEDGMTTADIYRHAFFLLHKLEKSTAVRYSLRKAIADLGPSGFPFERFVAEIFKAQGYTILVDQMVKGFCAEHEIDIVAYNDKRLVMSEIKFHNQNGLKTDLKVALYVKARFDDLRKLHYNYGDKQMLLSEGWLITNTKFTKSAISYAMCSGVSMIGWNYPTNNSLHDLVEKYALHPITSLTTLTNDEKKYLIEKDIILCKTIATNPTILSDAGFSHQRISLIQSEIKLL